jgi:outer membrane biosynthesis protein TonB
MPAIIECFERDALSTTRVVVDFTIGRTGKVTSTRTTSTGSPALQRCVASVFAKLTFPRPASGAVQVHYPVQICVAGQ